MDNDTNTNMGPEGDEKKELEEIKEKEEPEAKATEQLLKAAQTILAAFSQAQVQQVQLQVSLPGQ